jgi:hypothetical protein
MPKRRRKKKFDKVEAVKELARERVGTPPASQVIPLRKDKKQEKHKPTLVKLLNPDFS